MLHLLHSHYDFGYILRSPVKYVNRLLLAALKSEQEEKAFQMWMMHFRLFVKRDAYISFEDFYRNATNSKKVPTKQKTKEEIMDDVEIIQHSLRGGMIGNL